MPKREQDYISDFGIELRKGLFGARYIEIDDLLVRLALKGCDRSLLDWAVKNAAQPRSSNKTSQLDEAAPPASGGGSSKPGDGGVQ